MLHLLRCVACQGELSQGSHCLHCLSCGASYRIIDGIPDMMPPCLDKEIQKMTLSWENIGFDYDALISKTSPERLQTIDEPLLAQVRGLVLEVGCGTARLAKPVEQRGGKYIGIDPSRKLLNRGRDKGVRTLVRGVGEYLPFPDNCFDTLIGGYQSFRYIKLERAYPESARVLKPGGIFAFTLWNYWSLWIHTLVADVRSMRAPWLNFISRHTDVVCNDVVWFSREQKRLQRSGFKVLSILSTRRLPLLNRYLGWRGYWHGSIGALIGYDIIVICLKT